MKELSFKGSDQSDNQYDILVLSDDYSLNPDKSLHGKKVYLEVAEFYNGEEDGSSSISLDKDNAQEVIAYLTEFFKLEDK